MLLRALPQSTQCCARYVSTNAEGLCEHNTVMSAAAQGQVCCSHSSNTCTDRAVMTAEALLNASVRCSTEDMQPDERAGQQATAEQKTGQPKLSIHALTVMLGYITVAVPTNKWRGTQEQGKTHTVRHPMHRSSNRHLEFTGSAKPHVILARQLLYSIAGLMDCDAAHVTADQLVLVIVHIAVTHRAAITSPPHLHRGQLVMMRRW